MTNLKVEKTVRLSHGALQYVHGEERWIFDARPVGVLDFMGLLSYVKARGGKSLSYRETQIPVDSPMAVVMERFETIYGVGYTEDLKRRMSSKDLPPWCGISHCQLRSGAGGRWTVLEPVVPIRKLLEVMQSIPPVHRGSMIYMREVIPIDATLRAYEDLQDVQGHALRKHRNAEEDAKSDANMTGFVFGVLTSFLGKPYQKTWEHLDAVDPELISHPDLGESFEDGFCQSFWPTPEAFQTESKEDLARWEDMISGFWQAIAYIARQRAR